MKRKLISGILATTLALATMSTCVFAAGDEVKMNINGKETTNSSVEVTGAGTVIYAEDIYDVILPTNLSYALDVNDILGASGGVTNVEGSAIYSGSFGVINHSSTALQIDAKLKIDVATTSDVVVTSKAVITANNTATDTSVISTDPYINLELAPVLSSAGVHGDAVKVGNATYAAISGIQNTDIATEDAMALSSDANTMIFALTEAAYDVSTHGVSIETTNGGFYVSGDAADIEKEYKGNGYNDDPVVAFTITGDVNKYANWKNVELPEITAVFTLTPLTKLEWDSITFSSTAGNVVSEGGVASVAEVSGQIFGTTLYIGSNYVSSGNPAAWPAGTTVTSIYDGDINLSTVTKYDSKTGYITVAFSAAEKGKHTINFTVAGKDYSVSFEKK